MRNSLVSKARPLTKHRAGFIPRNNLDSKKTPIFRPQTPPSPIDQGRFPSPTSSYSASDLSLELPRNRRRPDLLASINKVGGKTLGGLGDSSFLFFQTPPDLNSASDSPPSLRGKSPIPIVLGAPQSQPKLARRNRPGSNMVNERSPAKAPLRSVEPNEQPHPRKIEVSVASKSVQPIAPQFGQASLPNTTLQRPAQKESSVFIQPKSRPEHHRESGTFIIRRR